MSVIAVIPARFHSTRFPGKPLARETGRPLIQHVCERVREARRIERALVATDDPRIAEAVAAFGGDVVMTRADHPSGTDRIAEAVRARRGNADDLIVNVQGDEPEIDPAALDRLVERMHAAPDVSMGTLACAFDAHEDPGDPNRVKVVVDSRNRALYFSRSLVPYPRDARAAAQAPERLHIGVYAYRRGFLLEYASWPPGKLEQIEQLEQLRVLERGESILVVEIDAAPSGVDTPEDYQRFVRRWRARQDAAGA